MDALLQFFLNRWPLITLAVVAMFVVGWVTARIVKRVERSKYLEEKCKDMPCAEHTAQIGDHKGLIERLDNRMEKLESISQNIYNNVVAIQAFLQSKYKTAAQMFSQKFSPRRLNEKGVELFEQFGGREFLDANGDMLMERMSAKSPRTALDVEQVALEVLYETLDNDIYNEIKLKVYNSKNITIENNGKTEEYSITMNDICFIFSIDLRDRYLSKHPEVPQKEA